MNEEQKINKTRTRGKQGMDRRSFLKKTAAVGGGAMISTALPGLSAITLGLTGRAATLVNPEIPPEPIPDSKITTTLEADVVIIGAGVAGLSAARAAAEAGASVIVIEKAKTYQYRSGGYGIIGSKVQKSIGMDVDKNAAILESLKQMGYRAEQRMWKYWADHSGAAFDWMLELAPDAEVVPADSVDYDESKIILIPQRFPPPPGYDPSKENSPSYSTHISFGPDQGKILDRVYRRCLDKGCKFLFSMWAHQLIRPNNKGRVQGVVCQDSKGMYVKILADKGVVLAAGDYANNKDMIAYYTPWAINFPILWTNNDATGKPTNTGDGQRMGIWVGAKMEDGPHAPVTHTLGGPLGVDAFFLCNAEGKRFVNEDVGGQQLSNALYRQPGNFGWQIFDDKWPEQIGAMSSSLWSVNYCVDTDKMRKLKYSDGYTTREEVRKTKGIVIADSIKELMGGLGFDTKGQETLIKSIMRYNDLCGKGMDEDFGKTAKRLFPIATPPFYAGKMNAGDMIICMGGLTCNPETGNVLDKGYKGIEGLYAAGNTMGGRFLVDYPLVTSGASHGFALTYGRLVGMTIAAL
jgi:fumarate reductase flavoprotein subunit